MKKIVTCSVFYFICIILFSSIPLSVHAEKEIEKKQTDQAFIMTHGKEDIVKIQLGSSRIDIDKYPGAQLDTLIYRLNRVELLAQKEMYSIKRGEDYVPISFIYSDGLKDVFFFFKSGDNWYVETDNGSVYENADFIADFTSLTDFKKPPQAGEGEYTLGMPPENLKIRLELEKAFDTLGTDFEFVFYTKFLMENTNQSQTEAVNAVRNLLTENMMQNECAKQLGITVSDEEMNKIVEKYISDVSQADYFMQNYNKIYMDAGISLQESAEKNKEIMRADLVRSRLEQYIRKEFADGNDRVGDHVYENTKDYFRAYLVEIAYPQIEESVLKEFEDQLDSAEKLYYEKYAESPES